MPKPHISCNLRQFKVLDMLRLLSFVANLLKNWLFCWQFRICSFLLFRLFPVVLWGKPYTSAPEQDECDAYVLYPNPICTSQNIYWKECHGKLTFPRLQLSYPGNGKRGLCNALALGSSIFSVGARTAASSYLPGDPSLKYLTLNSCANVVRSAKSF